LEKKMPGRDIIVVGASAGGIEPLVILVRALSRNLPAAIFIVLHIPADSPSLLPEIIGRATPLKVAQAKDGAAITYGHIYIAPPDNHLLVERDRVRVVPGPRENRHRPAVDPLFRSAALAYGPRVAGVVLSGALDDGTAGMLAVKQHRGVAIIQEPIEALYPGMPRNVKTHVDVDYILPVAQIGPLLNRLASETRKVGEGNSKEQGDGGHPMSENPEKEVKKSEFDTNEFTAEEQIGKPSVFSCPNCGGVLWEIQDGDLLRFRCRVGHAFSVESVLAGQDEVLEDALWMALKTLEESADLSRRLAQQAHERGRDWLARHYESKLRNVNQRIEAIRKVLLSGESIIGDIAENPGRQ
jgi:two-component system chemotaxis response regulator CheB